MEQNFNNQCSASAELRRLLEEHERLGHATPLLLTGERVLLLHETETVRHREPAVGRTLKDMERAHIERICRETNCNVSKAARILGIDRGTLYKKLKRYGLK